MKDGKFSVLGLVVLVACSSESPTPATDAGSTLNVGGSRGLGRGSPTAVNSSGGTTLAAAGSPNWGGANSTGGLANDSGGVSSIGGNSTAVGAGGTFASGGTVSAGGSVSSGGLLGLGGTLATGGGASTTGGTPATGGAPTTTGGKTATGGTATGGAPTMGGTPATGGTATGGAATGGAATGGAATGGAATGGAATGGTATGGTTCTAPASSAIQYVDPAAGTDDAVHGGAFGACAYKSLTFALTRATGQIALQTATYSTTTETFPIILTGSQQLLCKYTTATSAIIQGKGLDTVTNVQTTVAFRGTRNALNNCKIDGNGGTGYCVHVTSSGSFSTSPHIINSSDIGNCGSAAITIRYADNVTVTSSSIHNSQVGVSWLGPNSGGSMLNNTFMSNSISDIQCSIADPGVTGSGNTALGGVYCSQCGNCPF